jgi:hypothetical protein
MGIYGKIISYKQKLPETMMLVQLSIIIVDHMQKLF